VVSFSIHQRIAIPLLIIVVSAAALAGAIYYYYTNVTRITAELTREEIRSNAETQAHDLSVALKNGIESVTTNLEILSNSPSIQEQDDKSRALFLLAQDSTKDLTDFYMWLDKDGKVAWTSDASQDILGRDRSYRDYFLKPQSTLKPYFGEAILTEDDYLQLHISYPIIEQKNLDEIASLEGLESFKAGSSDFKGVVVAGIGLDVINNYLKENEFDSRRTVLLIDNSGTLLYSKDIAVLGKNIFEDNKDLVDSSFIRKPYLDIIANYLRDNSIKDEGSFILDEESKEAIATDSIIINDNRVWTIFVVMPDTLTGDLGALFDQQNLLSVLTVFIFGMLSFGIAFLLLASNKKLEEAVNIKTEELSNTNKLLNSSNKQLLDAYNQLKAHDKMQNEFINIASHEIKTPTQAILLHSDLLKRGLLGNEESLDAIIRNAARLQRLTNNILDVTRIESQTLKLNKETFDLNVLILELINDFDHQIKMKYSESEPPVKIIFNQKGSIIINADKSRITQVLSNMLANAIEFTSQGTIEITIQRDGNQLVIAVKDSGKGIDPNFMPHLFTKFSTRSDKGTGLGLFISKNIVEMHGGKIWAENNKVGSGSTFYFTIPVQ